MKKIKLLCIAVALIFVCSVTNAQDQDKALSDRYKSEINALNKQLKVLKAEKKAVDKVIKTRNKANKAQQKARKMGI
jgi:hypothetical protein